MGLMTSTAAARDNVMLPDKDIVESMLLSVAVYFTVYPTPDSGAKLPHRGAWMGLALTTRHVGITAVSVINGLANADITDVTATPLLLAGWLEHGTSGHDYDGQ